MKQYYRVVKFDSDNDDDRVDPPFAQRVMDEPIPPKFKMSTFKIYEGTTDLVEHVETFEAKLNFHVVTNPIKCEAFQISIDGATRNWYKQIMSGLIATFRQLRKAFISQFSAQHDAKRPSTHLLTIR